MSARAPHETDSARAANGWHARLTLGYARRGERSVLVSRRHEGPLAVQRPFYPEPDGTCHTYVLHPPGGVVGGDSLSLDVTLAAGGTRALLTTPAATKFYRSQARLALQRQRFRVGAGSRLEWLPQENIVFDGAEIELETRIELEGDAELIAAELLCLGRPAIGEHFSRGRVLSRLELERAGAPLLLERACYRGGSELLARGFGLRGQPVLGVLVCVARAHSSPLLDSVRAVLAQVAASETAVSELPGALVCRYLGASTERAQRALRAAWAVLRREAFGVEPVAPRIWVT